MAITLGPKLGLLNNANIQEAYYDQFRQFLQALDQLIMGSVINTTLNVPPSNPSNGDSYLLLTPTPSGAWTGQLGNIAVWDTQVTNSGTNVTVPAWVFYTPNPGWILWNVAASGLIVFSGSSWGGILTSISGTLPIVGGGTGATTAPTAISNLGAAARGVNTDITSLGAINQLISGTPGSGIAVSMTSAGANSALLLLTGTGALYQAMLGFSGYSTQTTVGSAGSASALPADPSGYLPVQINGTAFVIPYYKAS